jgi:hypothetical protein
MNKSTRQWETVAAAATDVKAIFAAAPRPHGGQTECRLEMLTTAGLAALRDVYGVPCPALTGLERPAILLAIETEMGDRGATIKSRFACGSEIARLQALLEERGEEISSLQGQVGELKDMLKAVLAAAKLTANGEGKDKP